MPRDSRAHRLRRVVAANQASGTVNIYPQEIESAFTLPPKVADVGVIGVPDPEMGERVVAFVAPAPGVEVTDDPVGYKVPREFRFREALPRTPTGKMVKGKFRDEYATTVS